MSDSRNPPENSEATFAAEKALREAQKLPPGSKRSNALRKAGSLRNKAISQELARSRRGSNRENRCLTLYPQRRRFGYW